MNIKHSYLMDAYSRQEISFASGSGIRLWDNDGVEYIDAISGVAVTSLGHSHPEIASAIAEQASQLMHTSNLFKIDWQRYRQQAILLFIVGSPPGPRFHAYTIQ